MSAILQKMRLTEQDYLKLEATREFKNEYVDGDYHAMSGASEQHNRINGKIFFRLHLAMQGKPNICAVYSSDMKCCADQGRIYYYPDVILVCDKNDNAQFYKEQPCFIAEVQSPSTERIDRIEKWQAYSNCPA